MTPTQGCAALALGSGIQPLRGLRSKPRHNPEMTEWLHIKSHAGDAGVVSTVRSDGKDVAFVERPEVEGAPLIAKPLCG